jgi:sortase (surface protein transpeptidase)
MLKALFELFVLYLAYKLIFDFIIPVYQSSKQVKQKVNEMQRTMNEHMRQQQQAQANTTPSQPASPAKKNEDYIDFEEVK